MAALAAAGAEHERKVAVQEAAAQSEARQYATRVDLARAGIVTLLEIFEELRRRISETVVDVRMSARGQSHFIVVGGAQLELDLQEDPWVIPVGAFPQSKWDVVTGALIEVEQEDPRYKWTANLWYTNKRGGDYRWYEVGYQTHPLSGKRGATEPFALPTEEADLAHGPAMQVVQAAYGPLEIDDEAIDEFCDRWAHLLAMACNGKLGYPPRYPPFT